VKLVEILETKREKKPKDRINEFATACEKKNIRDLDRHLN
jgi:hypothetical protein